MRTHLLVMLAALLLVACSEPRCPRDLVQDRMICRKCPEGALVKNNLCTFPDGALPAPADEDDSGEPIDIDEPSDGLDAGPPNAGLDATISLDGSALDSAFGPSAADARGDVPNGAGVEAGAVACDVGGCCDGGPSTCGCPAGTKLCEAACIEETQCCEDPDCPSGARCLGGQCRFWCEEQARPANVVAADYQCLDFDRGLPPTTLWSRSPVQQGTVAISTTRAASAPNSLETSAPVGDTSSVVDDATLKWRATGATPIASIVVSVALSPTGHPTVVPEPLRADLICVTNANGKMCLSYSYGDSIGTLDGVIDDYRALFVSEMNYSGAFIPHDCVFQPVSAQLRLNANVWNTVMFDVRRTTVDVTVNGTKAQLGTCGSDLGADTNAEVSIGVQRSWGWSVLYDNVHVSVLR